MKILICSDGFEEQTDDAFEDIENQGTIWYEISKDALLSAYRTKNKQIYDCIENEGISAIDVDSMFASAIRDDMLYYGVTNGVGIDVDGEMIDPEFAIENIDIDSLRRYIEIPTNNTILKCISEYEIKDNVLEKYI